MKIIKRISFSLLTLLLCALFACSLSSCGEAYEDGVLYDGTTVVGADPEATALVIKDGTTAIAAGAFKDCAALEQLTIPASVARVGKGAFSGCDRLVTEAGGVKYAAGWAIGAADGSEEISLSPDTVGIADEAFAGCDGVKRITIPESVKHIGERALFRCDSLLEITLPFIGESQGSTFNTHFGYIFGAYSHDKNSDYVPKSLTSVTLTASEAIFSNAFNGCKSISDISLPDSLKSIGDKAFYGCTALSAVYIPDGVGKIGAHAFYECVALGEARLPENAEFTTIEQYAFAYCSSLSSLTIPDSVTEIRACAIARCTSLTTLVMPDNDAFTTIGQQAFDGCKYLESVTVPAGVIGRAAFKDCQSLGRVTLGSGVEKICDNAFYGCTSLSEIVIPESTAQIEEKAFINCTQLKSVSILGSRIERVEAGTFYGCSSLSSLKLPDSVKSIGEGAFDGCFALERKDGGITYVDGWIVDVLPAATELAVPVTVRGFSDDALADCENLAVIRYGGTESAWEALTAELPYGYFGKADILLDGENSD